MIPWPHHQQPSANPCRIQQGGFRSSGTSPDDQKGSALLSFLISNMCTMMSQLKSMACRSSVQVLVFVILVLSCGAPSIQCGPANGSWRSGWRDSLPCRASAPDGAAATPRSPDVLAFPERRPNPHHRAAAHPDNKSALINSCLKIK